MPNYCETSGWLLWEARRAEGASKGMAAAPAALLAPAAAAAVVAAAVAGQVRTLK